MRRELQLLQVMEMEQNIVNGNLPLLTSSIRVTKCHWHEKEVPRCRHWHLARIAQSQVDPEHAFG